MIKPILIALSLIILINLSFAQKAKVVSAYNHLQYNELMNAKDAIDLASVHQDSKNMVKTWYYRGLIYHTIYSDSVLVKSVPNSLVETFNAFIKTKELDSEKEFAKDTDERLKIIAYQFYNEGVNQCKTKEFEHAIKSFDYTLKIIPNDQQALFNSAYAAHTLGDNPKTKHFYHKLIEINYPEPKIYHLLSEIYKNEKDTVNALKVIQTGRSKYPNNNVLIIDELNIYLHSGRQKEAISKLHEAINLEPNNSTLYFALGVANDKIKIITDAESAYKKAIEIKPDYFDAVYNLGALYFNHAVDLFNEAQNLSLNDYPKAKTVFDKEFENALPYLEKARELNPKDKNTILSLRQLYTRMGKLDKLNSLE